MKYRILLILLASISNVLPSYLGFWDEIDDFDQKHNYLSVDDNEIEDNEVEKKEVKVCKTRDCEILGQEYLRGMNKSVNPCDNFYDFMCGSWESNYKIPPYSAVWSRPYMFQETVFRRIKGILETKPTKGDILPVKQAKKWYRGCMDTDALDKRGIKPLESILMQLGGWPMTIDYEEWDEDGHSWQRIEEHYFHITGSYVFYDIDIRYYGSTDIELERGSIPLADKLPTKYRNYSKDKFDGYMQLIEAVVKIFVKHNNANVTDEMIKKDVKDLVRFEKLLYTMYTEDDSGDYNSETPTIDEFIEDYNNIMDSFTDEEIFKIDFKKIIKSKFDMINHELNTSMPIDCYGKDWYINITQLLNDVPKRVIVNYLHWNFVSEMMTATTEEMRNTLLKYMEAQFGVKERGPRWLECTSEVEMEGAAAYAFVKKYFSKQVERTALDMINNIREEMEEQISSSNWMDQETKDLVVDKLKSMKVSLGFPDWYKNKTAVQQSYKGLSIGYDHFDNVLSYKRYKMKKRWRAAMSKKNRWEEMMAIEPLVVNAFYAPSENFIELPAADFQPPLFTPGLPSVINYGSVGCIIGHEMGHGFDVNGIRYGKDGNDTEISETLMDIYYKRAECFLHQFNNYFGETEPPYEDTTPDDYYWDERSRGRQTRGENMADTTGLHSVVLAYKKMREKNPDVVVKLPGFEEYTDDQMFFISFGALWCEMKNKEFEEMLKNFDSHSPSRIRVIGTVSNSNDFAQAFKCPEGSPMNPVNKCNVWKDEEDKKKSKRLKNHRHPWNSHWA